MACRGVHFAIDHEIVTHLRGLASGVQRLEHIQEVIEEDYFSQHPEWLAETDKSWDWMHRALTDGDLSWNNGEYPLNHVIMGGESLYDDADYIISLKTPQQVADTAIEIAKITRESFEARFRRIPVSQLNGNYEEDFEYTWDNFVDLREFWMRAAASGRFVIFTVDQ